VAKVRFSFDGKNEAAQKQAKLRAARMVTRVSKETKEAVRALVVRAIRDGIPPYEAARMIKSMVGLTALQAQGAMNYRASLIEQGHTLDRVDKLTDKYTERKIKERAWTIARTEIMDALNAGAEESWRQAKKKGFLSADAKKEFIVTGDERLCPVCGGMEDQQQPIDKPFITATGKPIRNPPVHPRCRCTMALAVSKIESGRRAGRRAA
jgi:hypothetical protein